MIDSILAKVSETAAGNWAGFHGISESNNRRANAIAPTDVRRIHFFDRHRYATVTPTPTVATNRLRCWIRKIPTNRCAPPASHRIILNLRVTPGEHDAIAHPTLEIQASAWAPAPYRIRS